MRILTLLFGALLLAAGELAAQSQDELLQIEIAAAQRTLSDRNIARNMIEVDGAFAAHRVAPGVPAGQTRPEARTRAIRDAVFAPSTYRRPYGETLLIMSQPRVEGGAAQVTATLYRMTPAGHRLYETWLITLRSASGGWQVASAERLGAG